MERSIGNVNRKTSGSSFSSSKKNSIGNKAMFEHLGKLAWSMMNGTPRALTDEALYYHNTSVSPRWARKFVRTTKIGSHIFYRPSVKLSKR